MSQYELRYDRMVETALRDVVRQALSLVAEHGLPGNHHFFITFRTDHPDVEIATALVERYPGDMTIVLQHQFWALKVSDDMFEVTLSFNDKPERLIIPYAAISSFADPSVRFGLQFDAAGGGADEDDESEGEIIPAGDVSTDGLPAPVPAQSNDLHKGPAKAQEGSEKPQGPDDAASDDESGVDAGDGNVVTLDAFRKK